MSNSLVVAPIDTATPLSGAGLLDSGSQLAAAIESGDWVQGTLAGIGVALDTAATVIDPLGSLIGAGLGWLIDHLEPLKGWFNDFTGDAGEVAAFAQTWANIQAQLQTAGTDLMHFLGDVDDLAGQAMDAYRRFQADTSQHISAAASWAGAMSTGLQIASTIVQVVHDLVRDVLSQLVGSIISWAAEAVFTLGLATPVIIGQVTTRVASLSSRVGRTIIDAVGSCKSLSKLLDELTALLKQAGNLFDSVLKGGTPTPRSPLDGAPGAPVRSPDAPTSPHGPGSPNPHGPDSPTPDAPGTSAPHSPGSTTPHGMSSTSPHGPGSTTPRGPDDLPPTPPRDPDLPPKPRDPDDAAPPRDPDDATPPRDPDDTPDNPADAPVDTRSFPEDMGDPVIDRSLVDQSIVNRVDAETGPNNATFWSGRVLDADGETIPDAAMNGAADLTGRTHGSTLEQLLERQGVLDDMPDDWMDPATNATWRAVSESLAKDASGDVRAFLGDVRETSVWNEVELPTLIRNPDVTSITVIDAKTGDVLYVYTR